MVVFLHFLLRKNAKFKRYFKNFSFKEIRKSMLKKIINLGLPSAMQMLFEVALFTLAIWLSGSLGKNSQAANQIALVLASTTFMVAMGLSVTAMIRVSYVKGSHDYKGLIVIARSIFLLTIILETVFALFFMISHNFLPHLFLNMSDALGALRGLQDVKIPMYITFVAYWIIGFPISFYLGKYTNLQAIGIWIGLLAGLSSAALFLYIRFARLTKKLALENL